jgi:hypothetical protein
MPKHVSVCTAIQAICYDLEKRNDNNAHKLEEDEYKEMVSRETYGDAAAAVDGLQ